jgi:hypothetical protein
MSGSKIQSSTLNPFWKLPTLRSEEESGIPGVAVKCVDIGRNTSGEGGFLVGI